MKLSNKATFSLASLILLLALVFATTSVMAHSTNVPAHTHPLGVTVEADLNGDGSIDDLTGNVDGNDGDERILAHNHHPKVVSITPKSTVSTEGTVERSAGQQVILLADADATTIVAISFDTAPTQDPAEFTLVVEYDSVLSTGSSLDTGDYSVRAFQGTSDISSDIVENSSSASLEDGKTVEIILGIPLANYYRAAQSGPPIVTAKVLLPIYVWVDIDAGVVNGIADNDPVLGESYPAATSYAFRSNLDNRVEVVQSFDAVKPTLTETTGYPMVDANGMVTFKFSVSEALGMGDAKLTDDDITVTGGTVASLTQDGMDYTLMVTPTNMYTDVTVTIAADAIADRAGNNLVAAFTSTYTAPVDGDITIPAESYVVVVRDKDAMGNSGLAFPPDALGVAVNVAEWAAMPDLHYIFDLHAPGGGGALIVTEAGTTQVRHGSVGISEIMTRVDEGYLGHDRSDASQWIELHNLNSTAVTVTLSYKTGTAITSDDTITGKLTSTATETDVLDVVTNFFNNSPGKEAWVIPGSNGNSVAGNDFVSIARILPDKKSKYENKDGSRYDNRDGRAQGHWGESGSTYLRLRTTRTDVDDTVYLHKGTPGNVNSFTPQKQPHIEDKRTVVASNRIIFNEVANRSNANKAYEWIELRNVTGGEVNLKNHRISAVTAVDTDKELINFGGGDLKVPAGGILLLLASDPVYNRSHPIQIGAGVQSKVITFQNDGLPDDGNFVLILRGRADGKPDGIGTGKPDHVLDIAGYHTNLKKPGYTNAVSSTELWPLKDFEVARFTNNKLEQETVRKRVRVTTNKGGSGAGADDYNNAKPAFVQDGYTGIGYKRLTTVSDAHGGTPGFPNGNYHSSGDTVKSSVYISEIMYADPMVRNREGALPQWIELRNTSKSVGVNLHNWRLSITNHADMSDGSAWKGKGSASALLNNLRIKPNSSVLIASRRAVQRLDVSTVHMPNTDIFILWDKAKNVFGTSPNADVINPHGFKIKLEAKAGKEWQLIDEVNNLDSAAKDNRGRSDERYAAPLWLWPEAISEDGYRISVVRRAWIKKSTGDFTHRSGTEQWSWELSTEDTGHDRVAAITYYGNINDISSPGLTYGQPLPVSLSSFRPALENGEVVIRWTTESELDNAGFNILRSETRGGEFKQVNSELIQGQGTTGERSTYKWVDESAKPGVVYYYQIEDVSFAGERQTLTVTKLKGLISAKNKLTTTWSELKSQD